MFCGIPNDTPSTCWDCRFFDPPSGNDRDQPPEDDCLNGECRRHPPTIDHARRDVAVNYAMFPIVIACDWCGDFQPRRPTLPTCCVDQANAAFDSASQQDAPDAAVSAHCGECDRLPELSPARGV
jgi:hypothetical protein